MLYLIVTFTVFIHIIFFSGISLNFNISIILSLLFFLSYLILFLRKRINILNLLFLIVCTLPFIHMIEYLWLDFNSQYVWNILNNEPCSVIENDTGLWKGPCEMWGLVANPYQVDTQVVNLMSTIGFTGILSIFLGSILNVQKYESFFLDITKLDKKNSETLPLFPFFIWVSVAFICAYFTVPQGTILSTAYVDLESSISSKLNFGSLIIVSFILFIYAFADYIVEKNYSKKKIKGIFLLLFISIVVLYFQILRGDRESITFLISLIVLFFLTPSKKRIVDKNLIFKFVVIIFIILFLSIFTARFRTGELINTNISNISEKLSYEIDQTGEAKSLTGLFFSNLINGTWSGSLLSIASVSGDKIYGFTQVNEWTPLATISKEKPFRYYYGKTYIEYILSLPPGFVADWLNYDKPINQFKGPAWEMRYGLGGNHGYTIPFLNFGIFGVFMFAFISSLVIKKIYNSASKCPNVKNLSFVGISICIFPHWIWYGDKYIINAIIIAYISLWLYKVALSIKIKKN